MSRYAGIIKNDVNAAPGICVSFFAQGCENHCKNCQNPETWDFDGGKEFNEKVIQEVIDALTANNIKRNLAIMGGEPLHPKNLLMTHLLITEVLKVLPETKIYVWTGYLMEVLSPLKNSFLKNIDFLIDGKYEEQLRDVTLFMRGSSNQRIWEQKNGEWEVIS